MKGLKGIKLWNLWKPGLMKGLKGLEIMKAGINERYAGSNERYESNERNERQK